MYDGTIRKNPLGKVTMKSYGKDTKDPEVLEQYTVDKIEETNYLLLLRSHGRGFNQEPQQLSLNRICLRWVMKA
jgi:hypothetical protein